MPLGGNPDLVAVLRGRRQFLGPPMQHGEIRQSFDLTAAHYAHRLPPYSGDFFGSIASILPLNKNTTILDLGCGQGEVSRELIKHVGNVVAFDFSTNMLELAYKDDRITYRQHDINAAPYVAATKFDHFFIGRAIQWMDPRNLQMTMSGSLHERGTVVVLGTDWAKETPWLTAYRQVRRQHDQGRRSPDALGARKPLERYGFTKLASIGVEPVEWIIKRYPLWLTIDDLLKNVLSYVVVENTDRLRADLLGGLSDFLAADNTLQATMENWALVYRRTRVYRQTEASANPSGCMQ